MINFYQWNKTFKTIINNYTPNSIESQPHIVDLKFNDLQVNGSQVKHIKLCKQKKLAQKTKKTERSLMTIDQDDMENECEHTPFKNSAIKQKFKSISAEKGELIKSTLKQQLLTTRECEISVHRYLNKKLRESLINSERRDANQGELVVQADAIMTHRSVRRYRTLSDQQKVKVNKSLNASSPRQRCFTGVGARFKADTQHTSTKTSPEKKNSNLISNHQSLLLQILKKQRQDQDKCLNVFSISKLNSSRNSCKVPENQDEETLTPKKRGFQFFHQARKGNRKSLSTQKHTACENTKYLRSPKILIDQGQGKMKNQ